MTTNGTIVVDPKTQKHLGLLGNYLFFEEGDIVFPTLDFSVRFVVYDITTHIERKREVTTYTVSGNFASGEGPNRQEHGRKILAYVEITETPETASGVEMRGTQAYKRIVDLVNPYRITNTVAEYIPVPPEGKVKKINSLENFLIDRVFPRNAPKNPMIRSVNRSSRRSRRSRIAIKRGKNQSAGRK